MRIERSYRVKFHYTAVNIPIETGNFNDAMYLGHKKFTDWFESGPASQRLAQFPYEVTIYEVVYDSDKEGREFIKSINETPAQ